MCKVLLNVVSLNQIRLNFAGIKAKKGGPGGGGGTPSYENGVYIQHKDGKLYTIVEWSANGYGNDQANGVAVISDEAKFAISKENAELPWSPSAAVVEGVFTANNSADAYTDFYGVENTAKIIEAYSSGAAFYCANYIFANGKNGYLPGLGEWKVAHQHKNDIASAMNLIGGESFKTSEYWTSTQWNDRYYAWIIDWRNGSTRDRAKTSAYYVRAFAEL